MTFKARQSEMVSSTFELVIPGEISISSYKKTHRSIPILMSFECVVLDKNKGYIFFL